MYDHALPTGQNAIVAIMPFEYNQEDSIIMNRYSIDRGFGRCTQLKTIKDTLCPGRDVQRSPQVNTLVKKGGVLIEKKKSGYRKVQNKRVAFESKVNVDSLHDGVVDKVLVYKERNGSAACKVRIRKARVPTLGDKFASRSAQKGTVGMILRGARICLLRWTELLQTSFLNPHADSFEDDHGADIGMRQEQVRILCGTSGRITFQRRHS